MFNRYGVEFSNYFGLMFEAYVGRILNHSVGAAGLLSEEVIRQTYLADRGKAPDWVVIEGEAATLVECKATRFSRAALATGKEDTVNESLKQVIKGLRQLDDFRRASMEGRPGLESLRGCKSFRPVLVTLEPMYLINSVLFRKHLDDVLSAAGVKNLPWHILSVDELERLQPHMAAGVGLDRVLKELEQKYLTAFLEELHGWTGLTFRDSFLYEMDRELYRRLGVPNT
jgi:hypothetical protein